MHGMQCGDNYLSFVLVQHFDKEVDMTIQWPDYISCI
jgi:hypothetical protein